MILSGCKLDFGSGYLPDLLDGNEEDEANLRTEKSSSSGLRWRETRVQADNLYETLFAGGNNEIISGWIRYFQNGKGRQSMEEYLRRSSRYTNMMKDIFKRTGLPRQLVYVAMIESGFNPYAISSDNAVGYWQFLAPTGREYGLRINGYRDERRDPVLSTQAAAEYLKDLYQSLGSWSLALAAYNGGKPRIHRAVAKYDNRDFWYLSVKKAFPRETINYIPKFMAAVLIGEDPDRYGFYSIDYEEPFKYDIFPLNFSINLRTLAGKLGISYREIRRLNPSYLEEYVYKDKSTFIRVPFGSSPVVRSVIAQCQIRGALQYAASSAYHRYRVRKGDTLSELAQQHGISVSAIRRMNDMPEGNNMLFAGQEIKIPYTGHTKKL